MESILRKIKRERIRKSQGFISIFFVIAVLLAFAIVFLILNKAWGSIKPEIQSGLESAMPTDSSVNISETLNQTTGAGLMFDKLLPFIIIGLFGFVLITAGASLDHPIMLVIGIVVAAVAILLGAVYSNTYQSISESSEFTSTTSQMPIQNLFMHYLPIIIFVIVIGVIVMVIISRRSGGNF